MKKIAFCFLFLTSLCAFCFSQNDDLIFENSDDVIETHGSETETVEASRGGIGTIPEKKRPRPVDSAKAEEAASKDENEETDEKNKKTILYGLPSEISDLLDDLIKNEDPRYTEAIYDLFYETKNAQIKQKILEYFTNLEDPCLEDFAVEILNDPYDEKKDVVNAVFNYVKKVHTKEAVPPVLALIESENENYFNQALDTLGEIGGNSEAQFISDFLDRDDLSDAQRQTLMSSLGKLHAENTRPKIVEILENEDENTFVRMYAAEALGFLENEDCVPVLIKNYSATDPNLRQYVIKGLSHYPQNPDAKTTIIQAIRDEHWKVRQEAIKTAQNNNMEDAVPFLIYRSENDSEKVIKNASFEAIAKLNTKDGNDFLVSKITDKKTGDSTKQKVAEVLLKEGNAGEKEILDLAKTCVKDDKRKSLRYALGKELAKNVKPEYEEICALYLDSKDTTTVNLGLDMYKNGKFKGVEEKMRAIAADKKANSSNRNRIKKMLNIEDEEKSTADDKQKKEETSEKTKTETQVEKTSENATADSATETSIGLEK